MRSPMLQCWTRIRPRPFSIKFIEFICPVQLMYRRNIHYFKVNLQEHTGDQNKLATGRNITNAIIEINNANNFKFLRLPMVIRKHDPFNIERFERQLTEKQRQVTRENKIKKESSEETSRDSIPMPVRSVEKPQSKEETITVESFLDTDEIVNELKAGGFTSKQSEIVMNLVKEAIHKKMNWVYTEMAPNVDIENNNYLFKAARNELEVEVTNSREIALMDLQNSSILLKRLINGLFDEMSTKIQLNDDTIKIELSQFKHENNLRQRNLAMKNTDLNNRIISELMSGLRSNIEQFRWELTRAGIFAIMFIAALLLAAWRTITNKYKAQERKQTAFSMAEKPSIPVEDAKPVSQVQESVDKFMEDPMIVNVKDYTINNEGRDK